VQFTKIRKRALVATSAVAALSVLAVAGVACKTRSFNKIATTPGGATPDREKLEGHQKWGNPEDQNSGGLFWKREKDYLNYIINGNEKNFDWYHNKPLGIQGFPYLLLQVLATNKDYKKVWQKHESMREDLDGTLGKTLGMGNHPSDYVTQSTRPAWADWGTHLKPAGERYGLPFGLVSWPDVSGDPGAIENAQTTFFSCAACHTSRVVKKISGKPAVRYYIGGAGTEIDAQYFAGLVYETAKLLTNIETANSPADIKPKPDQLVKLASNIANFDCSKYNRWQSFSPEGRALNEQELAQRKARSFGECQQQKIALLTGENTNKATTAVRTGLMGFLEKVVLGTSKETDYKDEFDEKELEELRVSAQLALHEAMVPEGALTKDACLPPELKGKEPSMLAIARLLKMIVGGGYKVKIMYYEVGANLAFRKQGVPLRPSTEPYKGFTNDVNAEGNKAPPALFGPRPGQMDAFGLVQGVVYLNAMRPDLLLFNSLSPTFYGTLANTHGGNVPQHDMDVANTHAGTPEIIRDAACEKGAWNKDFKNYYSQNAALSDIKSLFRSSDEKHANWDGNQGAGARVLASGLSSVGDPQKVFTEIHETANSFINDLPAPPYPFAVDDTNPAEAAIPVNGVTPAVPTSFASAKKGEEIFHKPGSCVSCHSADNEKIYNVGTDMNRALAVWEPRMRAALSSLTNAACKAGRERAKVGAQWIDNASGLQKVNGKDYYWCDLIDGAPAGSIGSYLADVYRPLRGTQNQAEKPGYKAEALYAMWQEAPYLHNGSVPTLRELLMNKAERDEAIKARFITAGRPQEGKVTAFVRGNIAYDELNGGFLAKKPDPEDYPLGAEDVLKYNWHDTAQRGMGNGGHEFFHESYACDQFNGNCVGQGKVLSEEERWHLVNYLKLK
jgi:mono/diheme cytochrome c family protein